MYLFFNPFLFFRLCLFIVVDKFGARCSSVVRAFTHGAKDRRIDLLNYFSFQPVHHDWGNKDRGMCYPVCGMVHIKHFLSQKSYVKQMSYVSLTNCQHLQGKQNLKHRSLIINDIKFHCNFRKHCPTVS